MSDFNWAAMNVGSLAAYQGHGYKFAGLSQRPPLTDGQKRWCERNIRAVGDWTAARNGFVVQSVVVIK